MGGKGTWFILISVCCNYIFLFYAYRFIKNRLSDFFNDLYAKMDQMLRNDSLNNEETFDDTFMSQINHQLHRLYAVLSANQKELTKERNKLQTFISDISHQVKTPITNLKLLNATLSNEKLTDELRQKYLNVQDTQLNKLDFLIQSLIKTSRLENGILDFHPEIASINHTIISSLESILVPAEKKHIEVNFDNSNDYILYHDVKWTAEALFNILENAVKYTPKYGRITVTIAHTNNYLKITIKDTGIGISPNDIHKIFHRFWRGDTGVTEGNGIGLYLCRKIITLQNGYILVNSTENVGTEFLVFLPDEN